MCAPMQDGSGTSSTPSWWLSLQAEATPVAAATRPGRGGATTTTAATKIPTAGTSPAVDSRCSRSVMLDWRLVAAPPLTMENDLPLAAQVTLLEAPATAPGKIRPVASASVAAGGVLAVHTLNPTAAHYLQLALEGGYLPPAAGPLLAISPASLSIALTGARDPRSAAAFGAATAVTNALLLVAPDGRHVRVTAESTSVGCRGSLLAPRVTRMCVPVLLINRCPGMDLEFRVVAAHAARKGAPPEHTSGVLAVDPTFAQCSRLESSTVRFVPTVKLHAGGMPTQVLPCPLSASASSTLSSSPSSLSSLAMLSVPHDPGGQGHGRASGAGGRAHSAAGLALEIGICGDFALSPPIPITEEELVQGAVIIDAVDPKGRKRRLTVHIQLGAEGEDTAAVTTSTTSGSSSSETGGSSLKPQYAGAAGAVSTRVVVVEPHVAMTNHTGETLFIRQAGEAGAATLTPNAVSVPLVWSSSTNDEYLQVRVERSTWSSPFALNFTTGQCVDIPVRATEGGLLLVRAEVRVVAMGVSHVSFKIRSEFPYAVENTTADLGLLVRQAGGDGLGPWTQVAPCSSSPFAWERPMGPFDLEMCASKSPVQLYSLAAEKDGTGDSESGGSNPGDGGSTLRSASGMRFADGEVEELAPLMCGGGGREGEGGRRLLVFRLQRGGVSVLRVETPASAADAPSPSMPRVGSAAAAATAAAAWAALAARGDEFRLALNVLDAVLALVDASCEEIAVLHTGGIKLEGHTGLNGGMTSAAVTVQWAQLDDMNITSAHPVVAREASSSGPHTPPLFDVKFTTKTSLDGQVRIYPYVKVDVTPALLHLCVHEPLIWRLADFASHLEFAEGSTGGGRMAEGGSTAGTDMPLLIGLMRVSAVRLRLSFRAAPEGRPRRAPRVLSSGPLSVANLDDMSLELRSLTVQRLHSRESLFWRQMSDAYGRQVWRQALRLLASVDVLDSVSQALGQASAGIAAMSMDPSFVRLRGSSSSSSFRAAVGRVITGDAEEDDAGAGGDDRGGATDMGGGGGGEEGGFGLMPHGLAASRAPPHQSIAAVGSGIMDGAEMLAKVGMGGRVHKPTLLELEGAMFETMASRHDEPSPLPGINGAVVALPALKSTEHVVSY